MTRHHALRALRLSGVALVALCLSSSSGLAQVVVYDPSNYTQNVLQAARALEQISHQIAGLQNQAQMRWSRCGVAVPQDWEAFSASVRGRV